MGSKRPCSYLSGCFRQQAHFAPAHLRSPDPEFLERNTLRYARFQLYRQGMVANGAYAAASQCDPCNACVPIRINSGKFECSRSQERLYQERRERFSVFIESTEKDGRTNTSHFKLFQRYLKARHPGSGMSETTENDFHISTGAFSHRISIHDTQSRHRLVAFATFDVLKDEACFHYLSYDPDYMKFSLGKFAWLALIKHCQESDIHHMYTGAWVDGSPKLDYKKNFSGLETIVDGEWVDFDPAIHRQGPLFDQFVAGHIYNSGPFNPNDMPALPEAQFK